MTLYRRLLGVSSKNAERYWREQAGNAHSMGWCGKRQPGRGKRRGVCAPKPLPTNSPKATEWNGSSRTDPLFKKYKCEGLSRPDPRQEMKDGKHREAWKRARLQTMHLNPGPRRGRRTNKTEYQKRGRREQRYGRQREREDNWSRQIGETRRF